METTQTSDQVLNAATRLFAANGYEGTSLTDIAKEVGIRKPSLLYHYNSKDDLRLAVLRRVFEHWNNELPKILQAATGHNRFDGLVVAAMEFFVSNPDRARLLLREMLDRPEELRAQMTAYLAPWLTIINDYIEKGKQAGSVRADIDSEAFVFQVIQMIIGGVATAAALSGVDAGVTLERHTQEIVRIARTSLFIDQDNTDG